ncbi:ty3-gypsy retrotransposon protein [Cucumis melo var. makuwa]|uniref:Ty3-gypsy retrotransposon protein n=1 Tax=Cucumis melo var. makuwa TaxID=1194695 RepID=A0A5D3BE96_CUCMM|nr:ty3-gypsy retrotransposon protein [Cucumis melo var. makuwa]
MQLAELVENREIIRGEANLNGFSGGKYPPQPSANVKSVVNYSTNDSKGNTLFLIRTITLRSSNAGEVRKEGSSKRLPDAEFQIRREKGLCFKCNKCNEKYSADHKCKMKKQCDLGMFVETAHYSVILGLGTAIQGKGICESLEVQMKEWSVKEDFLPLELRGVDVILGMQWLYSLGVTVVDWKILTLRFQDNGRQVCIKGNPSLIDSELEEFNEDMVRT